MKHLALGFLSCLLLAIVLRTSGLPQDVSDAFKDAERSINQGLQRLGSDQNCGSNQIIVLKVGCLTAPPYRDGVSYIDPATCDYSFAPAAVRSASGDWSQRVTGTALAWQFKCALPCPYRLTPSRGCKPFRVSISYRIATAALTSATCTINTVNRANNVANVVKTYEATGSLSTATQALPYLSRISFNLPAYAVQPDQERNIDCVITPSAAGTKFDLDGLEVEYEFHLL